MGSESFPTLADELMIVLDLLSFRSQIYYHSVAASKSHVICALDAAVTYVCSSSRDEWPLVPVPRLG